MSNLVLRVYAEVPLGIYEITLMKSLQSIAQELANEIEGLDYFYHRCRSGIIKMILVKIEEARKEGADNAIAEERTRREQPGAVLSQAEIAELRERHSLDLGTIVVNPAGASTQGPTFTVWIDSDHNVGTALNRMQSGQYLETEKILTRLQSSPTDVRSLLRCNDFLESLIGDLQKEYPDRAAAYQAGVNAGIELSASMVEKQYIPKSIGIEIRKLKHPLDESKVEPTIMQPNEEGDGANYEAPDYNYD